MERLAAGHAVVALALLAGMAACRAAPQQREYDLRGQILDVDQRRATALIRHQDIPGFMPAMTMPFRVKDVHLLDGFSRGDLVRARLVVTDTDAWLSRLQRVGHADAPAGTSAPPPVYPLLAPGDEVPEITLTAAGGGTFTLSSLRGRVVGLTFIYTRCPLPQFCPLMDRQFADLQRRLRADAGARERTALLSISFDPEYDTPAVLAAHARQVGADEETWRFATAPREVIDPFARQFGMVVMREGGSAITHNLRTAVIDARGRLVRVVGGGDWTPADLAGEMSRLASAGRRP